MGGLAKASESPQRPATSSRECHNPSLVSGPRVSYSARWHEAVPQHLRAMRFDGNRSRSRVSSIRHFLRSTLDGNSRLRAPSDPAMIIAQATRNYEGWLEK